MLITVVLKISNDYDIKCKLDTCGIYPTVTDTERGEVICGGCGLVLLQKTVDSNEPHTYTQEAFMTQTRTGPANSLTMHDGGLFTMMSKNQDSSGHQLTSKAKYTYNRLRTWDQRSKSKSINRNFSKAFTLLNAMKAKLAIPDAVIEKTAYIYRKATEKKMARGRSITPLLSACLYAACRETNTPRTLNDIAESSNVAKKVLSRNLRDVIKTLDLNLQQYDNTSFVSKLANNLGLKEKTKRDGYDILKKSRSFSAGKHPVAQAASALYISCLINGEELSQRAFAESAGVSAVTIRNRVAQIKNNLKLNF